MLEVYLVVVPQEASLLPCQPEHFKEISLGSTWARTAVDEGMLRFSLSSFSTN